MATIEAALRANGDGSEDAGKPSRSEAKPSADDWAGIWFDKLARHHRVRDPRQWQYTVTDVKWFLNSRLKAGDPAWKRLKIVEALQRHRQLSNLDLPDLTPLRLALQEKVYAETQAGEIRRGGR